MTFESFFTAATNGQPYPYQKRLAEADEFPGLIRAPTGAGKTAAIILAWLWRSCSENPKRSQFETPRRLVYTLPMRTLVEQTQAVAMDWVARLGPLADGVALHTLMGGEVTGAWELHPERHAIVLGTQDMLLSRALNRGYGASRFRWPVDFGLLNNDCLWVYDEPQLMGNGVATSAQLAGLRSKLTTFGPCPSVWMSATLEPRWLDTVDLPGGPGGDPFELREDDHAEGRPLHKRMTAAKVLARSAAIASKDGKDLAGQIVENYHLGGTQTLVVLNTVDRAKAVYEAIKKLKTAPRDVRLIHSRFRPAEREVLAQRLMERGRDRIIVATQVVEAGVDVSVRTLVTELCPWSSLVQRMGRCNRTGDDGPGRVFWVNLDEAREASPYDGDDLRFAREQLLKLDSHDVSPRSLEIFAKQEKIELPFRHAHVLRRRDLLDLFDTTPDLSGNDIDVSRFVRGGDDSDVQVFWRDLGEAKPDQDARGPGRHELCRVPVEAFRSFLRKERGGKRPTAYVWDHLDTDWIKIPFRNLDREVYPGRVILLPTTAGGYSRGLGWDETSTEEVEPRNSEEVTDERSEGAPDDFGACGPALSIADHTANVCRVLDEILESIAPILNSWPDHLRPAARWHDVGKGHASYQAAIRKVNPDLGTPDLLWAKSGKQGRMVYQPTYFRHELVSALAALGQGQPFEVAYLVACHHGKIRLSIRALPGEVPPNNPATLFALGVHDEDPLVEVGLGGGIICPATTIDLAPMNLGGEKSWTARALALRDKLGPFRLAYLEALLRAADRRASRDERQTELQP